MWCVLGGLSAWCGRRDCNWCFGEVDGFFCVNVVVVGESGVLIGVFAAEDETSKELAKATAVVWLVSKSFVSLVKAENDTYHGCADNGGANKIGQRIWKGFHP